MNLAAILNLAKFAQAYKATARLAAEIGPRVVPVLLKIVELENEISGPGQGSRKIEQLLTWCAKQFLTTEQIELVEDFASAIVAILNALKVFRK